MKKVFFFQKKLVAMVATGMLLIGCNYSDVPQPEKPTFAKAPSVEGNLLTFDDLSHFGQYMSSLKNMPISDLMITNQKRGFVSLYQTNYNKQQKIIDSLKKNC